MSQHWGVLERRHGNHHALGGHMHQGMQVLRRQDVTGPAAAGPSRAFTYRGGALVGPLHTVDLFWGNGCMYFDCVLFLYVNIVILSARACG